MPLRYLVFAGSRYYPLGGANDFKGSYNFLDDATEKVAKLLQADEYGCTDLEWAHIFDTTINLIIYRRAQ
jgi:hypothetical protein